MTAQASRKVDSKSLEDKISEIGLTCMQVKPIMLKMQSIFNEILKLKIKTITLKNKVILKQF